MPSRPQSPTPSEEELLLVTDRPNDKSLSNDTDSIANKIAGEEEITRDVTDDGTHADSDDDGAVTKGLNEYMHDTLIRIKNCALAVFYFILLEIYGIFLFLFAVFSGLLFTFFIKHKSIKTGANSTTSTNNNNNNKKRLLFTTAKMCKTLHLIRSIKWYFGDEYELYSCDSFIFHMSRFSKYIKKGFIVPYANSNNFDEYKESIMKIVNEYNIDAIIPGSSIQEAKHLAKLKDILIKNGHKCRILTSSFNKVSILDDKDKFYNLFIKDGVNNDNNTTPTPVAGFAGVTSVAGDNNGISGTSSIEDQMHDYNQNIENKVVTKYFPNGLSKYIKFPFSKKIVNKIKLLDFIKSEGLVKNEKDINDNNYKYILKRINLSTNRSESILRLPMTQDKYEKVLLKVEISEDEPWLLQEYINGVDYTICVGCVNGETLLKVISICCDYCVNYNNYEFKNKDKLEYWICNFIKLYNITGIICFDFRIDPTRNNNIYIFEANPRPHSAITLFNNGIKSNAFNGSVGDVIKQFMKNSNSTPGLDSINNNNVCTGAGVGNGKQGCQKGSEQGNNEVSSVVNSGIGSNGSQHVFWLFHELLSLSGIRNMHPEIAENNLLYKGYNNKLPLIYFDSNGYINFNIKNILVGRDAVLTIYDPWPVFISHCIHMPYLLFENIILKKCNGWSTFDLCIVKLTPNKFVA